MDDRWRQDDRNRRRDMTGHEFSPRDLTGRDMTGREMTDRERADRVRADRERERDSARDPRRESGAFGELYRGDGRQERGGVASYDPYGRGPQSDYGRAGPERPDFNRPDFNRPDRGRDDYGRDDYLRGRSAGPGAWRGEEPRRPDANRAEDRSWFDRARDEVGSWMGDDDADRRRRLDARDEGRERSQYGRGRDDDTAWSDPVRSARYDTYERGRIPERDGDRPGLWAQDDLRLAEQRRVHEERLRREEAERWRQDRRGPNRDW